MIQNPLTLLPARAKLVAYVVLGLAALALTAYRAADGDLVDTLAGLLVALGFGTAGSNVSPPAERRPRRRAR